MAVVLSGCFIVSLFRGSRRWAARRFPCVRAARFCFFRRFRLKPL